MKIHRLLIVRYFLLAITADHVIIDTFQMEIIAEIIRREFLAISDRWHRITFRELREFGRIAPVVAKDYRLVIHPDLLSALTGHPANTVIAFIGIPVHIDSHIEGWKILPKSEIPYFIVHP